MRTKDGSFTQSIDSRYPKSIDGATIRERLSSLAEKAGAEFVQTSDAVPFYIDPNSEPVQALVDCYNEFTGRDAKPFTIGGGTYARNFPCAVSFGPEEPTETDPEWVGIMHGPDEGASIERLKRSLKIYIMAIDKLMHLHF